MILHRLKTSADLSQTSYEVAKEGLIGPVLRVSMNLIPYAEKLRIMYDVDTSLPKDAWYVIGHNGGRFSPGVY